MVYPYVAKTAADKLVYFVDDGRGHLVLADYDEEVPTIVLLSEWDIYKSSYSGREDVLKYSDIVNAAWHFNPKIMSPIDRDSAVISKIEMGTYFPRIWRGLYDHDAFHVYNAISPREVYGGKYVGSIVATSIIFDELQSLFRYIEPKAENGEAYGHKLRELLIIACTEVETLWRSVLEDNSHTTKIRYSTNDYCKLIDPLRLKEWSVELSDYPDFGELTPFHNWDPAEPTQSLVWYNAYNAVKHHREENFAQANFINLVNSVAALHIMQAAQWGPDIYDRYHGNESSPFYTIRFPKYDISEVYTGNIIDFGVRKSVRYFSVNG